MKKAKKSMFCLFSLKDAMNFNNIEFFFFVGFSHPPDAVYIRYINEIEVKPKPRTAPTQQR
jgi:hypothetical protein